ncbi:MAG: hypothetical protein VKK07_02275 [Merismopediaceae bacterium]|nr:hypothetical protein [Merismopediaceae bacterium]
MPTPTIIEIDLREVLAEMNNKLDRIDDNISGLKDGINGLKVELADVKGDIKALDEKVSSLDKRLEKVEGSQNRQIWAFIGILFTAILGVVIRFVLMGLPMS